MARHFAGAFGMAMEERFTSHVGKTGRWASRCLNGALAGLEGEIERGGRKTIGTHLV